MAATETAYLAMEQAKSSDKKKSGGGTGGRFAAGKESSAPSPSPSAPVPVSKRNRRASVMEGIFGRSDQSNASERSLFPDLT